MEKESLEDRIVICGVSIISGAIIAFAVAPQQTVEILGYGFNKARAAYQKVEPHLKTINSATELAAMCAFGVWSPNWKPYLQDSVE